MCDTHLWWRVQEIDEWASTLNIAVDVLDEWMKVQRSWLYLQPIFDSGDIQKQLPTEYKRCALSCARERKLHIAQICNRGQDLASDRCVGQGAPPSYKILCEREAPREIPGGEQVSRHRAEG